MNSGVALTLEARTKHEKGLKFVKESGNVPAVLYDAEGRATPVKVPLKDLMSALARGGEHHPFPATLRDSDHTDLVVVKELQRDRVTRTPLHADLMVVTPEEVITVDVPVHIDGESRLAQQGLHLLVQLNEVTVKGKAGHLPDSFTIPVGDLKGGTTFTVADLEVSEELTVLANPHSIVFSIGHVRVTKTAEPESGTMKIVPGPAGSAAVFETGAQKPQSTKPE
ncbi:MAG: 50S ribosomal protein L25 [Mycobacterium leprae]